MDTAHVLSFAMGVVLGAVLGAGVAYVWTARLFVRVTRREDE